MHRFVYKISLFTNQYNEENYKLYCKFCAYNSIFELTQYIDKVFGRILLASPKKSAMTNLSI